MESLPPEVHCLLLSFLTVDDWMQCIHVSRSWRSIVPSAVAEQFTHLEINHQTRAYLAKIHYFSSVNTLSLDGAVSLATVPVGQIKYIKSFEFICTSISEITQAFGEHVHHIKSFSCTVSSVRSCFSVYKTFQTFSSLKHFHVEDIAFSPSPFRGSSSDDQKHCYDRLISLDISVLHAMPDIEAILGWLPNLRMFRYTPIHWIISAYFTCKNVLSYCPKITHIWAGRGTSTNIRCFKERWDHDLKAMLEEKSSSLEEKQGHDEGIQFAYFPDVYHGDDMVSTSTIQMLLLAGLETNGSLYFECLQVLHIETIQKYADLVRILKMCPNLNELVVVKSSTEMCNSDHHILTCPATLDVVSSLSKLRSVRLPNKMPFDTVAKFLGVPTMYANLEALAIQEQYTYLNGRRDRPSSGLFSNNVTPSTFDFLRLFKKLRKLELCFVKEHLHFIPDLPTVTELRLVHITELDRATMDILDKYKIVKLRDCNDISWSDLVDAVNVSTKMRLLVLQIGRWATPEHGAEKILADCTNESVRVVIDRNISYEAYYEPIHHSVTADQIDWDEI